MSVSRNAAVNLVGFAVQTCLTLATVPLYLKMFGEARFGVIAFVWLFLGYFAFFDMGLGRATSKYIAGVSANDVHERESIFWAALLTNLVLGIAGGLLMFSLVRYAIPVWLKNEIAIQKEVTHALPWLAFSVPIGTVSSVLAGALEGRQEF